MKENRETLHIGDLLSKTTFADTKGDRMANIMKHSTIFSFWDKIVGAKFSRFTRPDSIKFNKLYVSAKSPVVVQELSLYKAQILRKINSYSMPLGIEIKDLVLNYKNFSATVPETLKSEIEDKPVIIKNEQLDKIEIDKNVEKEIVENIAKIKFLSPAQKEKFSDKIIAVKKAKQIQDKKDN